MGVAGEACESNCVLGWMRHSRPVHRWINYKACQAALLQVLQDRGQNESLLEFNPGRFSSLSEAIQFWYENVRAVVGMHGGGLYNVFWSAPGTAVVEVRPTFQNTTSGSLYFWELAAMKNLSYWALLPPASNAHFDANLDCQEMAQVLQQVLSEDADPRGPVLDMWYQGPFPPGM